MIPADETFDGTFPFEQRFSEAPGFGMHYVDEGDPSGEPVVLLHGEPTWGYLYRNMIGPLSRHHRVIVPDQMGFGKSETPKTASTPCAPTPRTSPPSSRTWTCATSPSSARTGPGSSSPPMRCATPTGSGGSSTPTP